MLIDPTQPSTSMAANASAAASAAATGAASDSDPNTTNANNEPAINVPNDLIHLEPGELAPLSETLRLDELWNTLSDCLVELEETADHHAVLVLQPAVEAFFLVHASASVQVPAATAAETTGAGDSAATPANAVPAAGAAPANEDNINIDAATLEDNLAAAVQQTVGMQPVSPIRRLGDDDDDEDEDGIIEAYVLSSDGNDMETTTTTTTPTTPTIQQEIGATTSAADDDDDEDDPAAREQSAAAAKSASAATAATPLTEDQKKFLQFAEKHRTVLNQILRQSNVHLDGPFAVLVDHTRILDFDVKRRYFRNELERMDEGVRREELAVHVHRVTVFEDSFRELYRRNPEEWKNRFYIVFEDEEGQDAGGLLREWYVIISREIFNPMYALFTVSPGDRVTYMINPSSHANSNHLFYFKFVGRVIGKSYKSFVVRVVCDINCTHNSTAKAIYDNKLLECYFTRAFYKHILGIEVNTQDMESEDYDFYKGLVFLMENHIDSLGYDQTFSLEVQEFGVTEVRDLIPNGRNVVVTEKNKMFYIHLVCQLKMSGSIRQQ